MTMMEILTIVFAGLIVNMRNPVKIGMMVITLRALILRSTVKITGEVWIGVVIFLLFMGGILVVFIVVSALAPNENPKKIKKINLLIALIVSSLLSFSGVGTVVKTGREVIKTSVVSRWFLRMVLILMSLYFFIFLIVINKDRMSLRRFA